jgi:hypothetical protein
MISVTFFGTCQCVLIASDEGDAGKKAGDAPLKIEFLQRQLKVMDSSAEPIKDATVKPYAMRAKANNGTHYGWSASAHGPQPTVTTNARGTATVSIPRFVSEKLEIGQVSWIVDHPDFVTTVVHRDAADDPIEVDLLDGYRIAATAMDPDTEAVKTDLHAVMSGGNWSGARQWPLAKSGILVSRVLGRTRSSVRLIHMPTGKPATFSRLLTVKRPAESDRVFLKRVALEAGTRVEGILDPAVMRPIKNGKVVAHIVAGADGDQPDRQELWSWYDETTIKEDGSFVFESLPRGDVVQLIALCDGWVSRNPTAEELHAVLPWLQRAIGESRTVPQVFTLAADRIAPTIAMERAATCRVKVVGPDGKPLPQVQVAMWPNHIWLRGGSTILGTGHRTAVFLRQSRSGERQTPRRDRNVFSATTNEQGIAVISNLPGKPSVGLGASQVNFELPAINGRRLTSVSMKPGQATSITIRLQPKGTQVLGR